MAGNEILPTSPVMDDIIRHVQANGNSFAILFAQIGNAFERELQANGNNTGATAVAEVVQTFAVPLIRPV